MPTLGRRVESLEDRANRLAHLRVAHMLAAEFEVPLDDVLRGVEEEGRKLDEMKARGMTWQQIVAAYAEELGATVEEIERELERIQSL